MVAAKISMRNVLFVVLSLCHSVFSITPICRPPLYASPQRPLLASHWGTTNLAGPQVQLAQGLVTGVTQNFTIGTTQIGQDYFLGIPYAQPPLGELRFAKPQPLNADPSHEIDATKYGKTCLQPIIPGITSGNLTLSDLSEDCLSINVIRPSNQDKSLPVMVWIYGGAFTVGASQAYNASAIIGLSVVLNEPVIFVSFNYRMNAFGFLGAPELVDPSIGTLNAGLHDMIAALEWVQENIGAFGGNKDRVTVFGQSAGAMGIGSLLVAGGGDYVKQHNLFQGAIMQSGGPAGVPTPSPNASDLLRWTNTFAEVAGCPSSGSNSSIISCLRSKPSELLFLASFLVVYFTVDTGALTVLPFTRVMDGFFFEEGAAEEVRRGNVATVPIISGCTLDEGTVFAPHSLNSSEEMKTYLQGLLYATDPTPEQGELLDNLLKLYPDDPTIGSPYDPVGASKDDRFFGPYNQYKRTASIYGDSVFHSGRRALLDAYVKGSDASYPAWTYHYIQVTPGEKPYLGVPHSSELPAVFGWYAIQDLASGTSRDIGRTSWHMVKAWLAFANSFDPNRSDLPNWPKYGEQRQMLEIKNGTSGSSVIIDDFRKDGIEFLGSKEWTDAFNF